MQIEEERELSVHTVGERERTPPSLLPSSSWRRQELNFKWRAWDRSGVAVE